MTAGAEHRAVGFGESVSLFFKNYVVFEGRSSRGAFWWSYLAYIIGYLAVNVVANATGLLLIAGLYALALVVPVVASGIRRMHDTDRSGWWILLPIGNLVFWAQPGQRAANRFGPDVEAGR